ncbi:MAG: ABC transporter permease [Phycicoccus sp.]|nr:ABC transporter permease [Phycicoccus sp.]
MTVSAGQLEIDAPDAAAEETSKIVGRSPWQIARSRLVRDKVSMAAFTVVCIYFVMAVSAPILEKLGVIDPYSLHTNLLNLEDAMPTGNFGGVSGSHWFGVEPQTGRDLLSRLVSGVTLSMLIAVSATIFSIVVGTIVGIIGGYMGGVVDFVLGRVLDLILAFPQLLMLLALSVVLIEKITNLGVPAGNPSRIVYLILVLGFFGFPYFARIIRGQVLSLREREFVEAARSLGARGPRIWFTELLPNLWAPILVYTSLILPANVSTEAALSFLGVGVGTPTPTLGNVLTDSVNFLIPDPTYFALPGLAIFAIVLSFNLLGDGLRDALDPKSDRG